MIFDGPDDTSMVIGELFGTPSHKLVKSISSSGKSMLIDFRKHFDYYTTEFEAFIKYNHINSDCQSWLNLKNNMLMSPSQPNLNCSWVITKLVGSYITLEFSYIEVSN